MRALLLITAVLVLPAGTTAHGARVDEDQSPDRVGVGAPADAGFPMTSDNQHDSREVVVLLHGVGMAPWAMRAIERKIAASGYRVLNVSYPSRTVPMEELAGIWLPVRLSNPVITTAPRVHFVAHSMGSLLVRHLMANSRPANAGRVVMIAPPNHGSELADTGSPKWLLRWFIGVNLKALGTSDDGFWHDLPESVDYPTGVIAGTGAGNPLGRHLPKPNDGTVTVASTRLAGALDSIELPWSHTGILFRRRTADEVVHFLQHAKFSHNAD